MPDRTEGPDIIGRGTKDGARLFREWFTSLSGAAERGEHTAYVFVMGSLAEVLRVFDFQLVFPEINSLQTAVRRVAHEFLNTAEDYGYSPDICGYVKADVGVQLRHGEHPMGKIPKPSLAILTNACNTYLKWGEIWERWYHIPAFAFDSPGSRGAGIHPLPGDADFENDRKYVEYQLRELIGLSEKITGKKFDIDKLREAMGYTNEMSVAWRRILELNRATPAPFNALNEGTIYLGVATATEAAGIGALASLGVAFARRKVTSELFWQGLRRTVQTTAFIMLIAVGGKLLSWVLTYYLIPQHLVDLLVQAQVNRWVLMIGVQLMYILLGMFIDPVSMIIVTMPVLVPILNALHFDLIWFGILLMVNIEMALITPPVGFSLYIIKGLAPENVTFNDVLYGCLVFALADVLVIAILMSFPELVFWLPRRMG